MIHINDQAHTVEHLFDGLVMQGNKQLNEKLSQYALTIAQYLSMEALRGKGTECSMSELAERIQQSSATMTGIVDRLVEKSWVTRRRSDEDRRAVFVSLTAEGENVLNRVAQERILAIQETICKMNPADVDTFIQLLRSYMQAAGYHATASDKSH